MIYESSSSYSSGSGLNSDYEEDEDDEDYDKSYLLYDGDLYGRFIAFIIWEILGLPYS
jgi:hypothetical protein